MIIPCDTCKEDYYIRPSRFKRSKRHFCSTECKKTGDVVLCYGCRIPFYKQKSELEINKYNFCSNECKEKCYQSKLNVKCKVCEKDLYRSTGELNESGIYFCSNECKVKNGNRYTEVQCLICEKLFEKATADLVRYPNHCCSIECRSKFNDKRKIIPCNNCGIEVLRPPSLSEDRDVFCSEKCHNEWQDTKLDCICVVCNTVFRRSPSNFNKRVNVEIFCSQSCFGKYRYKDSFVEKKFAEFLDSENIKYIRNDRKIIKPLELDFWIPDYNFAVEINGPTHYKPIYGEEVLKRRKLSDIRKRDMCKKLGIKLRVVKPASWANGVCQRRFLAVIREIKNVQKN